MPRGLRTLRADATKAQALFGWGRRLVASATRDPASFNDSAHRRAAAEVELIEALLDALREAADHAPDPGERARQEQSRIVKVAEDHALAHLGEQLYVSDLCRVTGVSERSLEYAFKQTLGLTPVAYLTRLRLHRVRDLLLGPGQRPQTVSAVALEGGFWHFGEFSRAYKACFGESPSQTLRRRRLQPGSDHAAPQFGA
jgi:transcriptional regulator GlxA family with amidase domain